jgi:hypothetical protein
VKDPQVRGDLSMTLGYDPEKDIPDLAGKVFLVTGGELPSQHGCSYIRAYCPLAI